LNVTVELGVNPVPVSMRVNGGPPAVVLAGTSAPITGCVFVGRIVRVTEGEAPPALPAPGGSVTEIVMAP
jgi:hypothetical protein